MRIFVFLIVLFDKLDVFSAGHQFLEVREEAARKREQALVMGSGEIPDILAGQGHTFNVCQIELSVMSTLHTTGRFKSGKYFECPFIFFEFVFVCWRTGSAKAADTPTPSGAAANVVQESHDFNSVMLFVSFRDSLIHFHIIEFFHSVIAFLDRFYLWLFGLCIWSAGFSRRRRVLEPRWLTTRVWRHIRHISPVRSQYET